MPYAIPPSTIQFLRGLSVCYRLTTNETGNEIPFACRSVPARKIYQRLKKACWVMKLPFFKSLSVRTSTGVLTDTIPYPQNPACSIRCYFCQITTISEVTRALHEYFILLQIPPHLYLAFALQIIGALLRQHTKKLI